MKKLSLILALVLAWTLMPFAAGALAETTLTVYNWYDYIDESVLEDFENETGIKVDYVMFTTVEEMYVKMTTGGGKYDIIVPSDYIIDRLIKDDMLAPMDFDKMPNAKNNLLANMWNADYDLGNQYSVP